jgi:hypothetical protein
MVNVAVLPAFSEPGRIQVSILGFAAAGRLGRCRRRSVRHLSVFIGLGCIRVCLHLLALLFKRLSQLLIKDSSKIPLLVGRMGKA